MLVGLGAGGHFGVAGGKDCLVEKDEDDEMLLRGALAADFEGGVNIDWGAEDLDDEELEEEQNLDDDELEEEQKLLWEESEELSSSSSAMSPSSPLIKMTVNKDENLK